MGEARDTGDGAMQKGRDGGGGRCCVVIVCGTEGKRIPIIIILIIV